MINYQYKFIKILVIIAIIFAFSSCKKEPELAHLSLVKSTVESRVASISVSITTKKKWTIETPDEWIIPEKRFGYGDAKMNFTILANESIDERSTFINVIVESKKYRITVNQTGSDLVILKNRVNFDTQCTPVNIDIKAKTEWTVSGANNLAWCTFNKTSGSGNSTLTITPKPFADRNLRGPNRITITSNESSYDIVLEQILPNYPPKIAMLAYPENGATEIPINIDLSWSPVIDPDGDPVLYSFHFSDDNVKWITLANNSNQTSVKLQNLPYATKCYCKITATDSFGAKSESNVYSFTTTFNGVYRDGQVIVYQENSAPDTDNPVDIVILGDGYVTADYTIGGKFDSDCKKSVEALFRVEPYKTYKEYFRISFVVAHSQDRGVTILEQFNWGDKTPAQNKNTVFKTVMKGGGSTHITGDNDKVFEYAKKVPGVTDAMINNLSVILLANQNIYAGTCSMYSSGRSVARCGMDSKFAGTVLHEAGGHGFGRLKDEYITNVNQTIPTADISSVNAWRAGDPWSYGANITFSVDYDNVHWRHYFNRPPYTNVGFYEGASYYTFGAWKSEKTSCMINNISYFSAPSREAIVRRIMKIAKKPFSLNDFMAKDVHNPPIQTKSDPSFIPLAQPDMVYER